MFARGCGDGRARLPLGCLHKSGSQDFIAAALQNHFRQRLRRRPGEYFARSRGKYSAVARACKDVLLRAVKYRASVMRAQPAERQISVLRRPQQKTRPVILRIRKHRRAAHRNFTRMPDHFHRICNLPLPPVNRESAERSERAAEAEPTSKSAAADR